MVRGDLTKSTGEMCSRHWEDQHSGSMDSGVCCCIIHRRAFSILNGMDISGILVTIGMTDEQGDSGFGILVTTRIMDEQGDPGYQKLSLFVVGEVLLYIRALGELYKCVSLVYTLCSEYDLCGTRGARLLCLKCETLSSLLDTFL